MLSYTFINMHSQVSHTGPKGPLVVLCVCGGGGGVGESCRGGVHCMWFPYGAGVWVYMPIWIALHALLANDLWLT